MQFFCNIIGFKQTRTCRPGFYKTTEKFIEENCKRIEPYNKNLLNLIWLFFNIIWQNYSAVDVSLYLRWYWTTACKIILPQRHAPSVKGYMKWKSWFKENPLIWKKCWSHEDWSDLYFNLEIFGFVWYAKFVRQPQWYSRFPKKS